MEVLQPFFGGNTIKPTHICGWAKLKSSWQNYNYLLTSYCALNGPPPRVTHLGREPLFLQKFEFLQQKKLFCFTFSFTITRKTVKCSTTNNKIRWRKKWSDVITALKQNFNFLSFLNDASRLLNCCHHQRLGEVASWVKCTAMLLMLPSSHSWELTPNSMHESDHSLNKYYLAIYTRFYYF